jgi:hypothetical protein
MERVSFGQITFDAAPKPRDNDLPLVAAVSVSAKFGPEHIVSDEGTYPQLSHGEVCLVFVQDADGNLIAQGQGVVSIGFTDKDGLTIREQRIKV